MAFQQKENTGALFRNDRKEKESHPDYQGSLNVDGVDYWLSGWLNESKDGRKYFGLQVKPKEQQAKKTQRRKAEDDDDIPF